MKLPDGRNYRVVVVDPPWDSGGYPSGQLVNKPWSPKCCSAAKRGAAGHGKDWHWCCANIKRKEHAYDTMSLDDIKALDISSLLADDAWVFLWAINRYLHEAFHVLEAWQVKYAFTMTWEKPYGPSPCGYPVYSAEWCLVARHGAPAFRSTRDFFTVNRWMAPKSPDMKGWGYKSLASAKPNGFYALLNRVTEGPRIDLFNRRKLHGFDSWGHEAETGHDEMAMRQTELALP